MVSISQPRPPPVLVNIPSIPQSNRVNSIKSNSIGPMSMSNQQPVTQVQNSQSHENTVQIQGQPNLKKDDENVNGVVGNLMKLQTTMETYNGNNDKIFQRKQQAV